MIYRLNMKKKLKKNKDRSLFMARDTGVKSGDGKLIFLGLKG